ncbi:hypothetical protein GCM10018965_051600 [Nonomuraea roseola]
MLTVVLSRLLCRLSLSLTNEDHPGRQKESPPSGPGRAGLGRQGQAEESADPAGSYDTWVLSRNDG